ncbi:MAG: DUF4013 domain-containing protein [Methanobrevibacter sp.]|jgi:hypothetical protein|nr:DUF4013 domain-containing protein [Candidatus Methanoflexus mossambicus]
MNITELFKDALTYPIQDWTKFFVLGVFFVVVSLSQILSPFRIVSNPIVNIICFILFVVVGLILLGYLLSVIKETISDPSAIIPNFDFVKNFISGIKVIIVAIIYMIIPVLITVILVAITGVFAFLSPLMVLYTQDSLMMAPALIGGAVVSIAIVAIIALIVFVIFGLLGIIGLAVLAETDSIGKAVNFVKVFKKIGEIGWANYILFLIVFVVIAIVISLISSMILKIFGIICGFAGPFAFVVIFIGIFIVTLIFDTFSNVFHSRAIGLIYNESKNN